MSTPPSFLDWLQRGGLPPRRKILDPLAPGASEQNALALEPLVVTPDPQATADALRRLQERRAATTFTSQRSPFDEGTLSGQVDDMVHREEQAVPERTPVLPAAHAVPPLRARETTRLAPEEETSFSAWARENGVADVDDPRSHYDYRGYWRDIASRGGDQTQVYADGPHFPDTYKQHGHPSFSVESRYSTGPDDGGEWDGERYVSPAERTRLRAEAGPRFLMSQRPAFGSHSLAEQVDDMVTRQEHVTPPSTAVSPPTASNDATRWVKGPEVPEPSTVGPYQGTEEEYQRGEQRFDDALERRSDYLRQSPQMQKFERLTGGVTDAMLLGRTEQLRGALDPDRTTADFDLQRAALPEATAGDRAAEVAGQFAGMALPFAGGARALRAAGTLLPAEVRSTLGATGVGGRMMLGAAENAGFSAAHRGALEDPDLLRNLGRDAVIGAAFGAATPAPHGRSAAARALEETAARRAAPDARAIRFNQRMDEALGAGAGPESATVPRGEGVGSAVALSEPAAIASSSRSARAPEAAQTPLVWDMPSVSGASDLWPLNSLLMGAGGATVGAQRDPEHPARGAVLGGIAGLAGGLGVAALGHNAGARVSTRGAVRRFAESAGPVEPLTHEAVLAGRAELPHRFNPDVSARVEYDPAKGTYAVQEVGGVNPRRVGDLPDLAHADAYAQAMGFHGGGAGVPSNVTAGVTEEAAAASHTAARRRPQLGTPQPTPTAHPRREPLPLPPLHPDVDPGLVKSAWDEVSARYPRLAATIRGIRPLSDETVRLGGGAAHGTFERVLAVHPQEFVGAGPVFHELAHAAQEARRKIGIGIEVDPKTLAELEDYAYRVGRAHDEGTDLFTRMLSAGARLLRDEGGSVPGRSAVPRLEVIAPSDKAAIRTEDGRVFRGTDHGDAWLKAREAGAPTDTAEDGFITSAGRFVDREEGYRIAERAGQVRRTPEVRQQAADMGQTDRLHARELVEPTEPPEPQIPRSFRGDAAGRRAYAGGARDSNPRRQGYEAASKYGLARETNTFPEDSPEWLEWDRGWRSAQRRETPPSSERRGYEGPVRSVEYEEPGGYRVVGEQASAPRLSVERVQPTSQFGEADDGYLYHVTTADNAERIQREGFRPDAAPLIGQLSGPYGSHSRGRVFFTERPGLRFWQGRVADHLHSQMDAPPEIGVVRVPRAEVEGVLRPDEIGTSDANASGGLRAYYVDHADLQRGATERSARQPTPAPSKAPLFVDAAVRGVSGRVYPAGGSFEHGYAALDAQRAGEAGHAPGYVTRDGDFLTPQEVLARPDAPAWLRQRIEAQHTGGAALAPEMKAIRLRDGTTVTGENHGVAVNHAEDAGLLPKDLDPAAWPNHFETGHVAADGTFVRSPSRAAAGESGGYVAEPSIGGFDAQKRAQAIARRLGEPLRNETGAAGDVRTVRVYTPQGGIVAGLEHPDVTQAEAALAALQDELGAKYAGVAPHRFEATADPADLVRLDELQGAYDTALEANRAQILRDFLRRQGDQAGAAGDLPASTSIGTPFDKGMQDAMRGRRPDSGLFQRSPNWHESTERYLDGYEEGVARYESSGRVHPNNGGPPTPEGSTSGNTGLAMMRATGGAGAAGLYGYATGDPNDEAGRTARALGFAAVGAGLGLAPEVLRRVAGPPARAPLPGEYVVGAAHWSPKTGAVYVAPNHGISADLLAATEGGTEGAFEGMYTSRSRLISRQEARRWFGDNETNALKRSGAMPTQYPSRAPKTPETRRYVPPSGEVAPISGSLDILLSQQPAGSVRRVAADEIGAVMPDPERLMMDALNRRGAQVATGDLARLASGEMEPAEFAGTYGVSPSIARKYADHARTLADDAGYRSPLDSDEAAYDRPEREPFAYQEPPEPRPIDGVPDDSFLPGDTPPRRYGAGQGQMGTRLLGPLSGRGSAAGTVVGAGVGAATDDENRLRGAARGAVVGYLAGGLRVNPEAVTTLRRSAMLMNAAGRIRDIVSNAGMGATETTSELIGTGVDALLDVVPSLRGGRTMAFNVPAVAKAAYEGLTAGTADMARSMVGKPRLHRSHLAAEQAATASVEGAERVVMSNPILDAAVRVTGRFAGSVDSQAAVFAYEKSIARQARVIALNERVGRRVSRTQAAAMEADLRANPTDEMKVLAASAVAHATFTNESVASRILKGVRESTLPNTKTGSPDLPWARAGLDFIAPFRRVPGAVAGKTLEYSPLGAVKMTRDAVRLYKLASAGADPALIAEARRSFAMTTGRVGTGAGVIVLGAHLADRGLMTGAHLTPEQKNDGARPFSIKIAGRWWPLGMMPPVGPMLAVGAELHNRGVAEGAAALGENVADATLMRGMGDVREAVSDPDKAERFASSAASSFIPPVVGQVARIVDPVAHKPENPWQAIEARIPGLSQNVPARTGATGGEMRETASPLGRAALALFDGVHSTPSASQHDPLIRELNRIGARVSGVGRTQPYRVPQPDGSWRTVEETPEQRRQHQNAVQAVVDRDLRVLLLSTTRPEGNLGGLWERYRTMDQRALRASQGTNPKYAGRDPAELAREMRQKIVNDLVSDTKARWTRAESRRRARETAAALRSRRHAASPAP